MKQFFRYLYDCRYVWLWALLSGAVFSIVFALYGIPAGAVGYPLLMSAIFGVVFLVLGFLRYRKKHLGLDSLNPGGSALRRVSPEGGQPDRAGLPGHLCFEKKRRTVRERKRGTVPERI